MTDGRPTLRLDKWLWYTRLTKTRSLATDLCSKRGVRIDGEKTHKPHYALSGGEVLTYSLHRQVRVIKVLGLPDRRGPATEARQFYEDLAPPSRASAIPTDLAEDRP